MSGWGLLSSLCASSLSAAVIILAALLMRALFRRRTPQRVFCLLWDVALVRLLILRALPSPLSVWRWLPPLSPMPSPNPAATPGMIVPVGGTAMEGPLALSDTVAWPSVPLAMSTVLTAAWLMAALLLSIRFLWNHLRFRRRCADSLPSLNPFVCSWMSSHLLLRPVQIRTSDRISAPLTYGILHPVVLLPNQMDWTDQTALSFVLEHELQHIRHFDTLRKGLLTFALCLHWFNPLAWGLYILCSKDMELACDEAVTERDGDRVGYARTLLRMEERRSHLELSGSHFSQNALEERIKSIMKRKQISITALITILIVMSITVVAFATDPPERIPETSPAQNAPVSDYIYDHFQAVENDVLILSHGGEKGEKLYSVDGGKTWLSEDEYRTQYGGDDWQIEWWTAEDYALWLEEEKQVLQSIIGERGYTGGEGWFTWDQKRVDETIALYESILEDIKKGALYSKTITDQNGGLVEEVVLGSGTQGTSIFSFDEKDTVESRDTEQDKR